MLMFLKKSHWLVWVGELLAVKQMFIVSEIFTAVLFSLICCYLTSWPLFRVVMALSCLTGYLIKIMVFSVTKNQNNTLGQSRTQMCVRLLYVFFLPLPSRCSLYVVTSHIENNRSTWCFHPADVTATRTAKRWLSQCAPAWRWFCVSLSALVTISQWQWDQWGPSVRPDGQSSAPWKPTRGLPFLWYKTTNQGGPGSQCPRWLQ